MSIYHCSSPFCHSHTRRHTHKIPKSFPTASWCFVSWCQQLLATNNTSWPRSVLSTSVSFKTWTWWKLVRSCSLTFSFFFPMATNGIATQTYPTAPKSIFPIVCCSKGEVCKTDVRTPPPANRVDQDSS